jgi:hypothetical protein
MIDWLRLFPDTIIASRCPCGLAMRTRFWQHSEEAEAVLAERRQWLANIPSATAFASRSRRGCA